MHHMKQRWELAEKIAEKMGVTKSEGYTLIPKLTEERLLDRVLNNEPEAILAAGKLQWFGKPNPDLEEKTAGLNVMLWAIRKHGSIEDARKSFEKAVSILE